MVLIAINKLDYEQIDIGYIPSVVVISYFGSRGNRIKWIGSGAVLLALSCLVITSTSFIFSANKTELNLTTIKEQLRPSPLLKSSNAKLEDFLSFAPLKDRISKPVRQALLAYAKRSANNDCSTTMVNVNNVAYVMRSRSIASIGTNDKFFHNSEMYSIDGGVAAQVENSILLLQKGESTNNELIQLLKQYVRNRKNQVDADALVIRKAASAPFIYCSRLVNDLKKSLTEMKCSRKVSNFLPLLIIFIALGCYGVGRSMPSTLGIPAIDDAVGKERLPVYFATLSFLKTLGLTMGFLIGGIFNKFYYTLEAPFGLTPEDPLWVGAWWLGFLVLGLLTLPSALVLFLLPWTWFPDSCPIPKEEMSAKNVAYTSLNVVSYSIKNNILYSLQQKQRQHLKQKIKVFLHSYATVFTSKIFVAVVAGRIFDSLSYKGYLAYQPKYLENHYGIPLYKANQYLAVFGVFGFAMGTAVGGFIIKHYKMKRNGSAAMLLGAAILNISLYALKCFLSCNSVVNDIAESGRRRNFNYTSSCNIECGCDEIKLYPICNQKGEAFISPCHAGCRVVEINDQSFGGLEFSSCDCSPGDVLRKDYCQDDCKQMAGIFFAVVLLDSFVAGSSLVPGMLLLLRSVNPLYRSIALGLECFLTSLLANLPSPFLWGFVFDSACLVRNKTCTNILGACAIYNPNTLRIRVHLVYIIIKAMSILTGTYIIVNVKRLQFNDGDDKGTIKKIPNDRQKNG